MSESNGSLPERIPVFDPSGAVARWLAEGRGVHIWRNVDLSSANVGALTFTPADTEGTETNPEARGSVAPHWQVKLVDTRMLSTGFIFYQRTGVESEHSDTTAGFKAACRALDRISAREVELRGALDYDAPIGHVYQAFTVERVTFHSEERVHYDNGSDRPLASRSKQCVIRWSAIDRLLGDTPEEREAYARRFGMART